MFGVVVLEIPVAALMKRDNDGHDLALTQSRLSPSLSGSLHHLFRLVFRPSLTKIIDIAE
jgi:hypothetical protein